MDANKVRHALFNFSQSTSESLLKLFNGKKSSEELLQQLYIIKSIKIGLSYLNKENKSNFWDELFKGEVKHSSIYLSLENENHEKTGVLVQYGKYEFIQKEWIQKNLQPNICNIGFPYGQRGGLMFGEINFSDFRDIFCSAGLIHPRIDPKKGVQMTLSNFFKRVKKIDKNPWDLDHYEAGSHSCQEFVAAALKVIQVDYSSDQDKDDNLKEEDIPSAIRSELEKHKKQE